MEQGGTSSLRLRSGAQQVGWVDGAWKGLGRAMGVPCGPTCGVLLEQIWMRFLEAAAWDFGASGPSVWHLVWGGRERPQPWTGVPIPGRQPAPTQGHRSSYSGVCRSASSSGPRSSPGKQAVADLAVMVLSEASVDPPPAPRPRWGFLSAGASGGKGRRRPWGQMHGAAKPGEVG